MTDESLLQGRMVPGDKAQVIAAVLQDPSVAALLTIKHDDDEQLWIQWTPDDRYFFVVKVQGNYNPSWFLAVNPMVRDYRADSLADIVAMATAWVRVLAKERDDTLVYQSLASRIGAAPEVAEPDRPLSDSERLVLARHVSEARAEARTWDLSPDRLARIEEKLDRINESAGRLSRRDLYAIILGIPLQLMAEAILTGPEAQRLASTLAGAVRTLLLAP